MFNHKKYIYTIYEEKSFSKAAQKLYVSQPWLSAVVKKVEQEINAPIFDRSTNPISLTEIGEYYIKQIKKIIDIENETKEYIKKLQTTKTNIINIGSSMFFCIYVFPKLLEEFRLMYPEITLTLTEGDKNTLLYKLKNHKIDIILEAEDHSENNIISTPWATEEIILAVPASYSINKKLKDLSYTFDEFVNRENTKKKFVSLDHFKDENFLLLQKGNDLYNRSMKLCNDAGFTPKVSTYLTQMMTAYHLVCEGQGISFLRSSIADYITPNKDILFYLIYYSI